LGLRLTCLLSRRQRGFGDLFGIIFHGENLHLATDAATDEFLALPILGSFVCARSLSAICAARWQLYFLLRMSPSLGFGRSDGSSMVTAVWVLQVLSVCSCARGAAGAALDKIYSEVCYSAHCLSLRIVLRNGSCVFTTHHGSWVASESRVFIMEFHGLHLPIAICATPSRFWGARIGTVGCLDCVWEMLVLLPGFPLWRELAFVWTTAMFHPPNSHGERLINSSCMRCLAAANAARSSLDCLGLCALAHAAFSRSPCSKPSCMRCLAAANAARSILDCLGFCTLEHAACSRSPTFKPS
jgi:hypothetical protein